MSSELVQFEDAARQIERLLAELGHKEKPSATPAVTPEWIERAQLTLSRAGTLVTKCGPEITKLKTAPAVCHYREQLEILRKTLQALEPKLQEQSTALRNEHLRVKRLQSWASSVSSFK